jgi:hypothetical protein
MSFGRRTGQAGQFSGGVNPYYAKKAAGGLKGMVDQYNKAYQRAKAENQKRYEQMLNITDATTQQRAADVRTSYAQRLSEQRSQLERQGLGGSTIGSTLALGTEREQQASLNRLADQMQQTKLGIIERRMDEYPDRKGLSELIAGLGGQFGTQGIGAFTGLLGQITY